MTELKPRQVAQYAYDAGFRGQALTTAVAIAFAESRGGTHKHNAKPPDNSYGLWQINMIDGLGPARREEWDLKSNKDLFDPAVNARAAYSLWRNDKTWGDWTTYGTKRYRDYLESARQAAQWVRAKEKAERQGIVFGRPRGAASRTIVIDLNELSSVAELFSESARQAAGIRNALRRLATDIEPARARLAEPALAGQIGTVLSTLDSPVLSAHLDRQSDDAARVRRRAELADQVTGGSARHTPPRVDVSGLKNGHVPAGKRSSVGDGETMLKPVARQFRKMDAAAKTAGINLIVNSGYRTYAEQARLYQLYKEGKGNLAAPPGKSNHGIGISADLAVNGDPRVLPWLRKHAASFGFVNDVPSEPWHWTYKRA